MDDAFSLNSIFMAALNRLTSQKLAGCYRALLWGEATDLLPVTSWKALQQIQANHLTPYTWLLRASTHTSPRAAQEQSPPHSPWADKPTDAHQHTAATMPTWWGTTGEEQNTSHTKQKANCNSTKEQHIGH